MREKERVFGGERENKIERKKRRRARQYEN